MPLRTSAPSAGLADLRVPPPPSRSLAEQIARRQQLQSHGALQPYLLLDPAPNLDPAPTPGGVLKSIKIEDTAMVDAQGKQLPPEAAAVALAERLGGVRSVPEGDKLDLVGARARVDLVLEGLEGEPVLLYWQLLPAGGTPLPSGWWAASPSYRVTAGTSSDTGTVTSWVPLPKGAGPYRLELVLVLEKGLVPLDSATTADFD